MKNKDEEASGSASNGGNEGEPTRKKKRTASAPSTSASTSASSHAETKKEESKPFKEVAPPDSKQKGGAARREMDVAEQVLLQVEQMTKRLAHDSEFLSVTPKTSDLLMKKLEARLTNDMIKMYSAGWDGTSTRGMDVLDRLKQAKDRYSKVCDLINSMNAERDSPLATSKSLGDALRRVRDDCGIAVASRADVSVVLRMVTEALGKKEFDKVKEAIDGNAEAMKKLGSEASDLQMSIIQKNIIDMCREADEKTIDLVEVQLVSYLNVLQAVLILDTNFAIEVSRVHAVVILAAETFKKEEYPSLQSQKDEFVAKKRGLLQGLHPLATGVAYLSKGSQGGGQDAGGQVLRDILGQSQFGCELASRTSYQPARAARPALHPE
jgi:hypothetical protein